MDLVIGDVFRQAAAAVPNRMAAAMGPASLTFGELDRRSDDVAESLVRLGLEPGSRLVVWAETDLAVIPLFVGAAKAGVVFSPLSPLLGLDEAEPILRASEPKLVIVDRGREADGAVLAARLGFPLASLDTTAGVTSPAPTDPEGDALPDLHGRAAVAAERSDGTFDGLPEVRETDPHVVFFTSGSTGLPKGVVISHRASFLRSHPGSQLEPRGVAVCMYPMFHMAPWTISMQQWHARDGVVFVESASAENVCAAITEHGAERLNAIPAVWQRILEHVAGPDQDPQQLNRLRFADSGTSATPPDLIDAMLAAMPQATIRIFYGSTEAGSVCGLEHEDLRRKPNSIGVPTVSTTVRIDERGELCVRTPQMFDRYHGDPDATAAALDDGWYRTGDLAEVDADGYYRIVGRARDIIRTGGETVSPVEVEAVLSTCPGVADAAVVGIPDPRWGEIVCAVVVCADGAAPTLDELRSACDGRLAPFKLPRRLHLVDEIPRTGSTLQVQRPALVDLVLALST